MANLPPVDVHVCFCVCETLAFWRRNDESTSGARFSSCNFNILPVMPTVFQHVVKDCTVLADFVLLFLSLNQAMSRRGIRTSVHLL